MRAGIFLAYWPWFTPEEQVELAVLADELGLDSVWISEAWGQDAVSVLGLLAGKTERIALGSGLIQIPARPPTADRDGGRDARRDLRRALPARARRVRAAGLRGLVRRAVHRPGDAGRASTSRSCARRWRARPSPTRAASTRSRCGRARKPLQAAGQAGAGADPDLPRRGRAAGGRAGRRDRRRLAAVHARPRARRTRCSSRWTAAWRRRGARRADIDVAAVHRVRDRGRHRRGARRRAPVAGLLPRRDGLQGEELLRRAGRPRRARRRRPRVPGGVAWPATATRRGRRADAPS